MLAGVYTGNRPQSGLVQAAYLGLDSLQVRVHALDELLS
jgi:hypothetical protein